MDEFESIDASNARYFAELDARLATMTPPARKKRLHALQRQLRQDDPERPGISLKDALELVCLRDGLAAKDAANRLIEQCRSGAWAMSGIPVRRH
jgi:hypothetical protein